jgi:hypothetical protein
MEPNELQKRIFYLSKPILLVSERSSFADQKHSFYKAKPYIFEVLDYQLVADKSFWMTY